MQTILLQPKPKALPTNCNSIYGHSGNFRRPDYAEWYSCRDDFHEAINGLSKKENPVPIKGFYYGSESPGALCAVLDWVERILHLATQQKLKIYLCQKDTKSPLQKPIPGKRNNVVYVELSDFWKSHKLRFYFLTVIMRTSQSGYTKEGWLHPLEAIINNRYSKDAARAVALFLNGFTVGTDDYADISSNWVRMFGDKDMSDKLSRPPEEENQFFIENDPTSCLSPEEKSTLVDWVHKREGSTEFCF